MLLPPSPWQSDWPHRVRYLLYDDRAQPSCQALRMALGKDSVQTIGLASAVYRHGEVSSFSSQHHDHTLGGPQTFRTVSEFRSFRVLGR